MLNHQLENWLDSNSAVPISLSANYCYRAEKNPPKNDSTQLTGDTRTHALPNSSVIKLFHTLHSFMNNELKFKTYFL